MRLTGPALPIDSGLLAGACSDEHPQLIANDWSLQDNVGLSSGRLCTIDVILVTDRGVWPMADRGIALEGASVVVRGAFNPAVFSPAWFREQELVGVPEAEDQHIEIISQDVAAFSMGWLQCHVTNEFFRVSTSAPEEFVRLRDVAIGVLKVLSHTPVSALGINRDFHTSVATIEEWHAIGDAIVPKAAWDGVLKLPGMRTVTLWGVRPDNYRGQIQVQVEPSLRYPQSVFVATNDHYTLETTDNPPSERLDAWDLSEEPVQASAEKTRVAIQVLVEDWGAALDRAEVARAKVLSLGGVS